MITVPGYSVVGEIGRGGMAIVYRARQVLLDREVALKALSPQLAVDQIHAQRFLQEARMLASLGHPHIVPVYDVGVTPEGLHYFSMQLFTGGDFARRLREGIDEVELLRVLVAVAQALGFAHTRNYVHRDVTPANILFDERNRPVLTDFGIARALASTSRITATGLSVGTSHYMSPEQARGLEVDGRSDIYSLGVLVYEALVGKPPFDGSDGFAVAYAHVHEPVPRLPDEISRWQPLIDKALAKSPQERFGDCAEFIEGLRRTAPNEFTLLLKQDGVIIPPAPSGASGASKRKPAAKRPAAKAAANQGATRTRPEFWRSWPFLAAVVLVIIGVGLLSAYWLSSGDETTGGTAGSGTAASSTASAGQRPARDAIGNAAGEGDAGPLSTRTPGGGEVAAGFDGPDSDAGVELELAPGDLPTVEDPVPKLLRLARSSYAAQRFTIPSGNSAYDYYTLVLRIDPGNADATAGLAQVAQAYVDIAMRIDPQADLDQWLELVARAEGVARDLAATEQLATLARARTELVAGLNARADDAVAEWDRDAAVALYERALRVIPGEAKATRGLALARRVGLPGYVFRDGDSSLPEMVVVGKLAYSRHEVTVGQFRAFWRDVGESRLAADLPSCRDKEGTLFSARRDRTWQAPGFAQGEGHPVVCVSYPMAEAYASWVAQRSGKRYRLPNAVEWRTVGTTAFPSDCSGNIRDETYRAENRGSKHAGCSDGFAATAPVGSFAARKSGLYDVDGNVREWVSDCAGGNCRERLALGKGWYSPTDDEAAPAFGSDNAYNTIGFRILRELE